MSYSILKYMTTLRNIAYTKFCIFRCKMKCYEKFSDVDKISILTHLNNFETKTEQDIFLQGQLSLSSVDRKRPRKEDPKSRKYNIVYNIKLEGKVNKVCKKAFINLYGISEKRVRRLAGLIEAGKSPRENRGKSEGSRNKKVAGSICEKIHEHINTFPVKQTHYSNRHIKYLNAELNIKIMHDMFCQKYQDIKVTYGFYLQYYKEHFGYAFGRPQKDVCATCEELGQKIKSNFLNDNAKRAAAAESCWFINKDPKSFTIK